jgi:hypothetical protein
VLPTLRAFPSGDSGLPIADFVAVYSCEGSGGIAPHFPLPRAHRVIKKSALDLRWKIEGVWELPGAQVMVGPTTWLIDATWLFPGAYVVAHVCSRQGFLTSGSNVLLRGLPNLVSRSVTIHLEATHCRYTVAGTVWAFHPTSLVTRMGTCFSYSKTNLCVLSVVTLCPGPYRCQGERLLRDRPTHTIRH